MGKDKGGVKKPPGKVGKRRTTPDGALMKWINAINNRSDECLIWPFSKDPHGYGCVRFKGKMSRAHRVVCIKHHGPPPSPTHMAAHSCNNPSCCNPRHLRWATPKQNQADRVAAGTHSRGENHGNCRLSETDVREIKSARGIKAQKELADHFGVSPTHICEIQKGRKWAHVI